MKTLTEKILSEHITKGVARVGEKVELHIDTTLTQDATGTMAYLQLEAMGIDRVKTELSVSYVDHNTLQSGFENADDHKYLQTVANKYGVYFSKPGNGICHQVHLERFGKPGRTLLGSDSHTPTAGGIGMFAMGAGGLDVACAMAGRAISIAYPKVVGVRLTGALRPGVAAKDIILTLLKLLSVKGGVGKVIEYTGEGVLSLSVPERATICNMGAELGATTSIFPSDARTLEFLKKQGREEDYIPLAADEGATYQEEIELDLSSLEPMIALWHSPDNVVPVSQVAGTKVDQVCIGSCTNSSYMDLMKVAHILKGKKVHPEVSLTLSPGSKQVLYMLSQNGALGDIIASGARLLESTCGPCIGMGQSPKTDALSLRTFNRNFYGRSGTLSAKVGLVSPETAAASAIAGVITDPRTITFEAVEEPESFMIDDSMILKPSYQGEILRGPNIKPIPVNEALEDELTRKVVIKVGDNITTDDIMPAGAKVLPYRSNVEKISEFVFLNHKKDFYLCCQENGGGIIVGGSNYGQGSSREHAALAPMYLGIKAVIAKSFARIHKANLINFGILPLTFKNAEDYEAIGEMDELTLSNLKSLKPEGTLQVTNKTKGTTFEVTYDLSAEDIKIIKAGGTLNYIKLMGR